MLPVTHAYDLKYQIDLKHAVDKEMECRVLNAQLALQNEMIDQLRDELKSIDWHI